ncbi:hypothetical protein LJB84_03310 [Bacteroidales bacterium OttesenSCG-928-J19]|nr:hypothetical protein [Bacteroidales bacterium OttesenSCG-928-J19]
MELLSGLLYINDKDVFKTYGAYLTENKEGDFSNYSALMKPASMKPYTAVAFREEDGEKLPNVLTAAFEPRDITLYFAITAENKSEFLTRYRAFVTVLKSGWLNFYLPELGKTFRFYYKDCGEYEQLTTFDNDTVAARFKVKLREPKPTI